VRERVCVCVRETECVRERERDRQRECVYTREGGREGGRERVRLSVCVHQALSVTASCR
jgi:hypothetical protein